MSNSRRRTPAAIITGFLGSGKTTLLNRIVRDPGMARALVVINELGDIGLDHELVERATGDILLLASGCLCCTMRSDLVDTLERALAKAKRAEIPDFDRIVVETTGLADPEPIMQAFLADPTLAGQFDLCTITTTVDAVLGAGTLDRHPEAVKQAAVADRLLVTKSDLADPNTIDDLLRRLRRINAAAPIELGSLERGLDPAEIWTESFGAHAQAQTDAEDRCLAHNRNCCTDEACSTGTDVAHFHNDQVRTLSFVREAPIAADVLDRWVTSLLDMRGEDLLRFKAMVNVAGLPGPLVLHGVQHVIHPPRALPAWPSSDRRTRMVFITYGIDADAISSSLRQLQD